MILVLLILWSGFAPSALWATTFGDPFVEQMKAALPDEFKLLGPEAFLEVVERASHAYSQSRAVTPADIISGRLTLTTGVPVTNSDVTAATTVYYTPYNGNRISLYNGTRWLYLNFTERSVAVPSNTNTPFDIFAYNNSGAVALEATAWTNDTTRATALVLQDGIYVKSGALTRRYLGTGRTTGVSGQTEDSRVNRYLINYYNTKARPLFTSPAYSDNNTSTGFTYAGASYAEANSGTNARVNFIIPQLGWSVHVKNTGYGTNGSAATAAIGIGVDSVTTSKSALNRVGEMGSTLPWFDNSLAVGRHYIAQLVLATSGTTTYRADDVRRGGSTDPYVNYLNGWIDG